MSQDLLPAYVLAAYAVLSVASELLTTKKCLRASGRSTIDHCGYASSTCCRSVSGSTTSSKW